MYKENKQVIKRKSIWRSLLNNEKLRRKFQPLFVQNWQVGHPRDGSHSILGWPICDLHIISMQAEVGGGGTRESFELSFFANWLGALTAVKLWPEKVLLCQLVKE